MSCYRVEKQHSYTLKNKQGSKYVNKYMKSTFIKRARFRTAVSKMLVSYIHTFNLYLATVKRAGRSL